MRNNIPINTPSACCGVVYSMGFEMKNVLLVSSLILLLSFYSTVNAECVQEQTGGGEVVGTLLGAALGGLVGSQFGGGTGNKVLIGAGVVAGGLLGNKIGKSMDCQDQQYHYNTTQSALEQQKTGETSTWVNTDSGHKGEVKVIIETCYLTDAEKIKASLLVKEAGAHFVKTSTGFGKKGATLGDVALMRRIVGTKLGVKAAGGIRDQERAVQMVEAGASRIGASASIAIIGK